MSHIHFQSVRLDFCLSLCPSYSLMHVADTMKWIFLLFEFHWFLESCLPGGRMTAWTPAFSTLLLDVMLRTTLYVKHLSMASSTPCYGQLFPSSYFPLIFLWKIITVSYASSVLAALCPERLRIFLIESTEGGHATAFAKPAILIEGMKSSCHQTDIMLFPKLPWTSHCLLSSFMSES